MLFTVVIVNGFSLFLFTRIDTIVHSDLYRYGLQFSYDWVEQYWFHSTLFISTITIASIIIGLLIGKLLIKSIKDRPISAFNCCLVLIISAGLNICSIYIFSLLDHVVHNDLYLFGLLFNNEWATNYWTFANLLLVSITLSILILFTSFTLILLNSRKKVKVDVSLSDNSKEDEDLTRTIIQLITEKKPQNTRQLIVLVNEKFSIADKKVLDTIQELQSQGIITLEEQPVSLPLNFGSYLTTSQAIWYWATITIAILAVAIVLVIPVNVYPLSYIRTVFGTLFILWLPGYATTKMLFPKHMPIKTSSENFESIERIALSLGMSFALVPIVGLILNYTPFGLTLNPIVFSLLFVTITFATVAIVQEHKIKLREKQII